MSRLIIAFSLFFALGNCTNKENLESTLLRATEANNQIMFELPWSYQGDEGDRYVSDVWDIRTTIKYQHILDSLPPFYNALIERYTTVFGDLPYPKKKMDVYLFSLESQWQEQLRLMLGKEAEHWFQLESGGVTIDGTAVLYHLDQRGRSRVTLRIAAHEEWHQYAEAAFASSLPTWLDEGIGTWMEGFRFRRGEVQFQPASNWDRLTMLRKIVNANRLTSLEELMESDPSELLSSGRTSLLGYYAQLWGLVSFIVEYDNGKYLPALRRFLQEAALGTIQEPKQGWLSYFSTDPTFFESEYKEWVVKYAKPSSQWR